MFPAPSSLDLSGGELAGWKGLFIPGLQRVLAKHSMKAAGQDGLDYVERLLIQLVAMICSRPFPHTVQDLQV
jgi:son of sevenless